MTAESKTKNKFNNVCNAVKTFLNDISKNGIIRPHYTVDVTTNNNELLINVTDLLPCTNPGD